MDSASFEFILFGLGAAILSNLSRSLLWRSIVLLATTLVFIGILCHDPRELLPLAGFLLLSYGALVLLENGWRRALPWAVAGVILAYVWLKQYTFLPSNSFLHFPYFTLGLSYIFFRVLHLLIDCGQGEEKRHITFVSYLLYTLNFTTFVSGPIQRYDDFARDQFSPSPIPLTASIIGLQLERIVRGFFKVNVLAMLFNAIQMGSLAVLTSSGPLETRFFAGMRLAVVYPLFLYCNFSGYIDIVIAIARLMRIELPENFDRPFSAASFLDFWNRWHITLSTWLKTYVYNPLLITLMRRVSSVALEPFLGVVCFFVTFFLIGLWHGRTSEFLLFGILQGGGVAINKLWQIMLTRRMGRKQYKALANSPVYTAFGRGLTYTWFAFTLFWFWATWQQLGAIFHGLPMQVWVVVWALAWVAATAVLAAWEWLHQLLFATDTARREFLLSRYMRVSCATALILIAATVVVVLNQPAPDIVYKAF